MALKIPRWPFDKFPDADRSLGTQMKATGEVMGIERTFEAALLKSIRSLENNKPDLLISPDNEDSNIPWMTDFGILQKRSEMDQLLLKKQKELLLIFGLQMPSKE